MATDSHIWQAISRATGVTLATSLEDLIACLAHLQRWAFTPVVTANRRFSWWVQEGARPFLRPMPATAPGYGSRPSPPPPSGGFRDLGYGAGTSLSNPLEIPLGPAASADGFARVFEPVLAEQDYSDILLHVNVAAYYGYGPPDLQSLAELVRRTANYQRSREPPRAGATQRGGRPRRGRRSRRVRLP